MAIAIINRYNRMSSLTPKLAMAQSGKEIPPLKILVRKTGMNYRELAKRLGTTSSRIASWNQGQSSPSFRTAHRLAKELGVTLDELAESLGYGKEDDDSTDQETETE
jgi:transcriptional regulator with XRE-family HTH domain